MQDFEWEQRFSLLEHGLVPQGKACPYINNCQLQHTPGCFGDSTVGFSCGAARAHDLGRRTKLAQEFREEYEEITDEVQSEK